MGDAPTTDGAANFTQKGAILSVTSHGHVRVIWGAPTKYRQVSKVARLVSEAKSIYVFVVVLIAGLYLAPQSV